MMDEIKLCVKLYGTNGGTQQSESPTLDPEPLPNSGSDGVGNWVGGRDKIGVQVSSCLQVSGSSEDPELPTTGAVPADCVRTVDLKVPPNGLDGDG